MNSQNISTFKAHSQEEINQKWFYAVFTETHKGIVETYEECNRIVKDPKNINFLPKYKKFATEEEADLWLDEKSLPPVKTYVSHAELKERKRRRLNNDKPTVMRNTKRSNPSLTQAYEIVNDDRPSSKRDR